MQTFCSVNWNINSVPVWASFFQQKRTEQVINEFLTAYKNADGEKCGELLYSNISEEPISFSETQKLLAEKMSWKVKKHFFKWKKDEQVRYRLKILILRK